MSVIEHKICIFVFYKTSVWHIYYFKKDLARYCYKCENVFMWNTRYSFRILIEFDFFRQIFEKITNTQFHQIRLVGAELFHADRQTDMAKLIVAFRNSANAPKKGRAYF